MRFSRSIASAAGAAVLAGTVIPAAAPEASAAVTPRPPVITYHVVEKSGWQLPGTETKAVQAFRVLVRAGGYARWAGSEDFKIHRFPGGGFTLEYAPYGHGTGWFVAAFPRGPRQPAFRVPDARLVPARLATVFRLGLPGSRGYSLLSTRLGVLTAEIGGKLDLQPSRLVPGLGYPASQLWRLDAQAQR